MKEWCLVHPYLTFILFFICLLEVGSLLQSVINLFKDTDTKKQDVLSPESTFVSPTDDTVRQRTDKDVN